MSLTVIWEIGNETELIWNRPSPFVAPYNGGSALRWTSTNSETIKVVEITANLNRPNMFTTYLYNDEVGTNEWTTANSGPGGGRIDWSTFIPKIDDNTVLQFRVSKTYEPPTPVEYKVSYTEVINSTYYGYTTNHSGETEIIIPTPSDYSLPIEITADSGRELVLYYVWLNGTRTTYNLPDGTTTHTHYVNVKDGDTLRLEVVTAEVFDGTVSLLQNLVNCTSDFNEDRIGVGEQTITFTALSGYEFNTISYYEMGGNRVNFVLSGTQGSVTINVDSDIVLYVTASSPVISVSSFVNLYELTGSELTELSLERFTDPEGLDPSGGRTSSGIDYGDMITNLMVIPFNIPQSLIAERANVQLGKKTMTTIANKLNNYQLEIDLGTVFIAERYGNLYDYVNTRVYVHLPYSDTIEIDLDYAINQTIGVKYVMDLYSGDVLINVYSSFIDGNSIHNGVTNMCHNIPFVQINETKKVSNVNTLVDNGLRKVYIEVVRNIPIETTTGVNTVSELILGGVLGYVEVENIQLVTTASDREQDEIEMLLNKGVVIK